MTNTCAGAELRHAAGPVPSQLSRFAVRAESDPQAIMRIAGLFAQRGLVPQLLHAAAEGGDLHIAIEARLSGADVAALLLEKMRSLVLVTSADLTEGSHPCLNKP